MELNKIQVLEKFGEMLDIMDELRQKCPWDQKQTFDSLRYLTIEETYELADAIINKDFDEIKGELGDLLLHIVFYSKIGLELDKFSMVDVIQAINEKLIRRHPHIFADVTVNNEEDVKRNWEEIKLKEGKKKTVLGGVPQSLPAMIKATRIQEKARGVGFDWDNKDQVFEKVKEELDELQVEVEKNDQTKTEEEFGDLLFSMINYARFVGVDPEMALEKTNKKFMRRFNYLEKTVKERELNLKEMTLSQMDEIWEEAKQLEKK